MGKAVAPGSNLRQAARVSMHEGEVSADEVVVRRLLAAQAPEYAGLEVTSLGHGTDNTMYRLGTDLLVRLPRSPANAESLAKELHWLPWLGQRLSVEIPEPVLAGSPCEEFALPWAIYRWIDGEPVSPGSVGDWERLGRDLAAVVRQLHALPLDGNTRTGGLAGYRGGMLQPHHEWVEQCLAETHALAPSLATDTLADLWDRALAGPSPSTSHVWLHADLKPSNLLVRDGRLCAVIDFGGLTIGYPDAEHAPTWDLPAAARSAYRTVLGVDDDEWARARAWALLVGVSGVPYYWTRYPEFAQECLRRLEEVAGGS